MVASLEAGYGLPVADLYRVAGGQSTENYAGTAGGLQVFVKKYGQDTDLDAERAAISLSEFAAGGGVPTAPVIRTRLGEPFYTSGSGAISVWRFIVGGPATKEPLTPPRMSAAGEAVGRMHRVLGDHPAAAPVLSRQPPVCDVQRAIKKFDEVLTMLGQRSDLDAFEIWAQGVLRWRRTLMPRVAELQAGLPMLTRQVVHGDLATPNLLFDGDRLSAIIDFRPPQARGIAWELSRLAFDPYTVLNRRDWLAGVQQFLEAYHRVNGAVPMRDLLATVRVWLCYTATSVYPYEELISGKPHFPDLLRAYARDRQDAIVFVLNNRYTIEATLREHLVPNATQTS